MVNSNANFETMFWNNKVVAADKILKAMTIDGEV